MMSLGNNISITLEEWEKALQMPTASRFTKLIIRGIYSKEQLSKRSVAGDPSCKTPNGINIRKPITPIKHKAIRSNFFFIIMLRRY